MGSRHFSYAAMVLALAATYFAAAKLGLSLALIAEQVSPVWPPTGIALAAIVLLGYRAWPGIAAGAFLANITANEPIGTTLGITIGNTLEAVVGAWLLRRVADFDCTLERLTDVLALMTLGATVSTMISATIGVTSLCLGGVHPWEKFTLLWSVWWLGDATGALVVTPAILTWACRPRVVRPRSNPIEAAALAIALAGVGLTVFAAQVPSITAEQPLEYGIFAIIVWAALRFGQRGTATVILATSAVAIWGTLNGFGPFGQGTLHQNLISLQAFLAIVTVTALLLAAALAERDLADRRRAVDRAVTHVLAESATVEEAAPRVLREIGTGLGWEVGAFWAMDREARTLHCTEMWQNLTNQAIHFLSASRSQQFRLGEGLPGRVWSAAESAWIENIAVDPNFPRAPSAQQDGLRSALGFPVLLEGQVLGVMEFFSRRVRPLDRAMLQALAAIGSQFGQFIDRRRASERLRESERNLRLIAENTTDAVFAYSLDRRLIYVNPAFETLWGRPAAELLTTPIAKFLHPEDAPRCRALLDDAFRGKAFVGEEFRVMSSDGTDKWCLSSGGPLLAADGVQIGVQGRAHDITDRKRADEALREAGRRKDEFLAMLGHELRNPLAPIRNGLQFLRRSESPSPQGERVRDLVERQVEHLTRLVDDLLDISRITRGRIELRRERVNLAEVVNRAADLVRPLIQERGHELTIILPPHPVYVDGDAVRLAQVLANLLNNAAKYTEPGGHILLAATSEPSEVVIRVRDDGIGIDPELLPHVFDMFVQADGTLDRAHGGLGVGLSLVKRLVEMHNGSAAARSDGMNRGSEFVVRLPTVVEPERAEPIGVPPNGVYQSRGRRVLVVDDNVDAAQSLAMLLEFRGHEVRVAHDGQAAVPAVCDFRPDVVLLDLGLPGMNGYEVAREVRSRPEFANLVLAAVTGYGQEEDRRRSREAGFDYHFVKPVDPKDLESLLASV
jgi:PAS domain S-box-containing protein